MTPADVLDFWIGPTATDAATLGAKMRRWYLGGPALDAEIVARFTDAVEDALAGRLDAWADAPRDRLALILLLDQFTRSIFRGTPRAWAGDPKALPLALDLLDRGWHDGLTFEERNFTLMPLLHSEDLAAFARLEVEMRAHLDRCPSFAAPVMSAGMEQTQKYREILGRFGRYPFRNAALGRESTPEERVFLEAWGERALPKVAATL